MLYEGKPVGTPDAGAFWRVVRQHNVKALFTAPTALRAIRKEDPSGDFIRDGVREAGATAWWMEAAVMHSHSTHTRTTGAGHWSVEVSIPGR